MPRILPACAVSLLSIASLLAGHVSVEALRRPGGATDALRAALPAFTAAELRLPDGHWERLACSPDGRLLAAARREQAGFDEIWQLLLLNADGSIVRALDWTGGIVDGLAWGRSRGELLLEEGGIVWSVPASGGAPKRTAFDRLPRWSPDGALYVLPVDAGFQRFTSRGRAVGAALRGALPPSWSPSGQWLAYPQTRAQPEELQDEEFSPTCEIRLLEARGGTPRIAWSWPAWKREQERRRWSWAAGPGLVFWTPDGQSLVGLIDVRERGRRLRYLRRLDLSANAVRLAPVDRSAELLSASRDWRTWLIRLERRLYLLKYPATASRSQR